MLLRIYRAFHHFTRHRYDWEHQKKVNAIYSKIVAQDPSAALTPRTQKKISTYAREILGSAQFIPWLKVYAAYSGQFKEGWLPSDYYGLEVLPLIQGNLRCLSGTKTISRRLLKTELLPDIAYHVNGLWIDIFGNTIKPQNVASLIFRDDEWVFVKLDSSSQGLGVLKVERNSFIGSVESF